MKIKLSFFILLVSIKAMAAREVEQSTMDRNFVLDHWGKDEERGWFAVNVGAHTGMGFNGMGDFYSRQGETIGVEFNRWKFFSVGYRTRMFGFPEKNSIFYMRSNVSLGEKWDFMVGVQGVYHREKRDNANSSSCWMDNDCYNYNSDSHSATKGREIALYFGPEYFFTQEFGLSLIFAGIFGKYQGDSVYKYTNVEDKEFNVKRKSYSLTPYFTYRGPNKYIPRGQAGLGLLMQKRDAFQDKYKAEPMASLIVTWGL